MFTVTFQVDTNDADYLEETTVMNDERFIRLQAITSKLKKHTYFPRIEDHDSSELREYLSEVLTEDEVETFVSYIPTGEYGYATLESISFHKGEKTKLL